MWLGKKYIAPPISGSYKAAEAKHFPLELASDYDQNNLAGPSKKCGMTNQVEEGIKCPRLYFYGTKPDGNEEDPKRMKRRNGLLPQTRISVLIV